MKRRLLKQTYLLIMLLVLLVGSCNRGSDSQRVQEVQDSIKQDEHRREMLERANKMMEESETNKESTVEEPDTIN